MRILLWITASLVLMGCEPADETNEPPRAYAPWPMPNPATAGLPNPASYTIDGIRDTVIDNLTGLMWQRTCTPGQGRFAWSEAQEYCANLVYGGYSDWRLPSRIELVSLVDFTVGFPAMDTNVFPDPPNTSYWTSTQQSSIGHKQDPQAYRVQFTDGGTLRYMVNVASQARCVRLGYLDPESERYAVQNGTVVDTWRNLTWEQTASTTKFEWAQAQVHCGNLQLDGGGWRVPSMKELQTLVDDTASTPQLDPTAFPNAPIDAYWTSSRYADKSTDAWWEPARWGEMETTPATSLALVRCVR